MRTNIYAAACDCCGGQVGPREGRLVDRNSTGGWIVRHHDCADRAVTQTRHYLTVPAPAAVPYGVFNVWALSANGRWYKQNSFARPYGSAETFAYNVRRQRGWQEVVVMEQGIVPWRNSPARYGRLVLAA